MCRDAHIILSTIDILAIQMWFKENKRMPINDTLVLEVKHNGKVVDRLSVNGEEYVIGRSEEADYVLHDESRVISKKHALLYKSNNIWKIKDISTNGIMFEESGSISQLTQDHALLEIGSFIISGFEFNVLMNDDRQLIEHKGSASDYQYEKLMIKKLSGIDVDSDSELYKHLYYYIRVIHELEPSINLIINMIKQKEEEMLPESTSLISKFNILDNSIHLDENSIDDAIGVYKTSLTKSINVWLSYSETLTDLLKSVVTVNKQQKAMDCIIDVEEIIKETSITDKQKSMINGKLSEVKNLIVDECKDNAIEYMADRFEKYFNLLSLKNGN